MEGLRDDGQELPKYVAEEFYRYIDCGILARGFVRIRCDDCKRSMVVGFSCKGGGFCPSCTGRRMADTSARLVDDVFPPEVPVRQWVLSLPIQIRYRLAYDSKLLSSVLRVFLRAVQGWYSKQGKALGITECRGGSVTFAQRFGSALNLNPHLHSLVVDGVFNGKNANFHKAPPLRDEDVKEIVETAAHRVIRLLERQGVLDGDGYDEFSEEQPLLSGITAASIFSMVATGDRAGLRVRRVLSDPAEGVRTGNLCYASRDFSLHATTLIKAGDKTGLEAAVSAVALRAMARFSTFGIEDLAEALAKADKLKTQWSDGTTHLLLSATELLAKLAALVPPPRVNLVRHHGILAPHAKNRSEVVPRKPDEEELRKTRGFSKNRILWAALLARTFGLKMETCPDCGGRMRAIEAVTDPVSVKTYLDGFGLDSEIPKIKPPLAPPQMELAWTTAPEGRRCPSAEKPLLMGG